jgi:thioredoxin reductase
VCQAVLHVTGKKEELTTAVIKRGAPPNHHHHHLSVLCHPRRFLYKDESVVVVGGGDTAMEDALVLARTSKRVTVVHRGASFNKASHVLASKVKNGPRAATC